MKIVDKEMFGGPGLAHFEHILTEEEMHGMNRVYARVTLKPGCAVGYHVHQGDGEDYFILAGQDHINDSHERALLLNPGEHYFTCSGKGHSIMNKGQEDLVFMALIVYNEQK